MRGPVVICAVLAAAVSALGASVNVPSAPPLPSMGHGATSVAPTKGDLPQPLLEKGEVAPMPVTPPDSAPAKDDDAVTYDSGPAQYIDKDHRWLMTGGVQFEQGDSHLRTQTALVNLDQDMKAHDAKSLAPVHLWNEQDDLTGTHGFIDFTTHVATIKDHITLIAKPDSKPAASGTSVRRQFKNPATITCDEIVYDYKKRTGQIPGPLTVHQLDRTVTADSADYDGYRKLVTLKGHVHATLKDGSTVTAPVVEIGVEEGHEWLYIPSRFSGVYPGNKAKQETGGSDEKASPAPAPALPPIPESPESTDTTSSTPATSSTSTSTSASPTSTSTSTATPPSTVGR